MELKFLKSMQERSNKNNASRTAQPSQLAQLRDQFEHEFNAKQKAVGEKLKQGSLEDAQQELNEMKALIQDTSNSLSLTAYDMSKSNATLSRLQKDLDDRRGSSLLDGRKFKFSNTSTPQKLRRESKNDACESKNTPGDTLNLSAKSNRSGLIGIHSTQNNYGPAKGTTLFVPHSKAAFIKDCVDCKILALPIAGSVFVSDCINCTLFVACHQLRLRDCHKLDVYVCCASTPIIERCDEIRLGPYSCWRGLLATVLEDGRTYSNHREWVHNVGEIHNPECIENSFKKVDDFQWVRRTQSPNWNVLNPVEMKDEEEVFKAV